MTLCFTLAAKHRGRLPFVWMAMVAVAVPPAGDYQWLGEQESFEGPRMWDTPDGSFHEQVVITYYKQAVPGEYQGLTIKYSGPDDKLMMPRPRPNYSLTLSEVNPLLEKWGYRK
jgi:hypothetical protein